MPVNLVEMLKQYFGSAISCKLGRSIGLTDDQVQAGIAAMLPAIIAGLMQKAATTAGAAELNQELERSEFGGALLEDLPYLLGDERSDEAFSLSQLGGELTSGLLGDKASMITGSLTKTTGISAESADALMKLLLPLVLSMLGRQKQTLNLDADGVSKLLSDQRGPVTAAMPQVLAGAIGMTDEQDTELAGSGAAMTASHGGGIMKILVPGVLLVVMGLVGYKMVFQRQTDPVANLETEEQAFDLDAMALPDIDTGDLVPAIDSAADAAAMPSIDASRVSKLFESYRGTLDGVTDEATAETALPKLEQLNGQLTGLSETFGKLPAAVRGPLIEQVQNLLPSINERLAKVLKIPGVETILKPAIDTMLEKLSLFREG